MCLSMQVDGKVTSGPDLSVVVDGLKMPNPFVIGSGTLQLAPLPSLLAMSAAARACLARPCTCPHTCAAACWQLRGVHRGM